MRIILSVTLLAAVTFGGCETNTNSNANRNGNANNTSTFKPPPPLAPKAAVDPNFVPCNPYFPLVPGSVAKYVVNHSSGLVGDATVVVDAEQQNGRTVFVERTQMVDRSGGLQHLQSTVRQFVCDGERVILISEKNETRVEERLTVNENQYRENTVAMVDPAALAQKGTTWTVAFTQTFQSPGEPLATLPDPTIVTFTVTGPQEITIPTGAVKTVSVQRKVKENIGVDYYARGLGLVKRETREGMKWELREYSGLRPMD
ncbi:MAG: hypothetical protein ACLGJB_22555 [Blastocatellia bacterium]